MFGRLDGPAGAFRQLPGAVMDPPCLVVQVGQRPVEGFREASRVRDGAGVGEEGIGEAGGGVEKFTRQDAGTVRVDGEGTHAFIGLAEGAEGSRGSDPGIDHPIWTLVVQSIFA